MGYKITTLQNTGGWSGEEPTIKISIGDPNWEEAFETWKLGKPPNPTPSPEWKKGVFALTEIIEV